MNEDELMNILNNYPQISSLQSVNKPAAQAIVPYQKDVFDKISEKVINKRDINDTVTMPRTIFKGYMCFTAGTAINAISGMLKHDKVKKALGIAGSLISIYGTYNFVKPFLIRGKE